MKEFLMALGLEADVIAKVLQEVGVNYIPKDKFDKKNNELSELKDKYKDYENLKTTNTELQTKYSDLESKYNSDVEGYKEQVKNLELDNALNLKLLSYNPKNVEVVGKFIDKSKVTLENGVLKGLDEQMTNIKGQYNYLFNDTKDLTGLEPTDGKPEPQVSTLLGAIANHYKN